VSVWQLLVGDVITLGPGDRVPCDCLILSRANLRVTFPEHLKEGYTDEEGEFIDGFDAPCDDRLLFADSFIERGQCRALVCAVGLYSSRKLPSLRKEMNQDTPLQVKLQNLSNQFTFYALLAALALFALMIVVLAILLSTGDFAAEGQSATGVVITKLPYYFTLLVVIAVVSIPEGLPMTIGMALAYSMDKMHADGLLVKKFDAPERLGGV
jgi:Ca2+-transporting ATPase